MQRRSVLQALSLGPVLPLVQLPEDTPIPAPLTPDHLDSMLKGHEHRRVLAFRLNAVEFADIHTFIQKDSRFFFTFNEFPHLHKIGIYAYYANGSVSDSVILSVRREHPQGVVRLIGSDPVQKGRWTTYEDRVLEEIRIER